MKFDNDFDVAILRTLRLRFSVMYYLNVDVPSNKNLPQPEIQGSYIRGFTVHQTKAADNDVACHNTSEAVKLRMRVLPHPCA